MFGRNLGIDSKTKARFLYVWDVTHPPKTLEEEFYGGVTTNYRGHKFMMAGVDYGYIALHCGKSIKTFEEVKPGEDDPQYLGCSGYEAQQAGFMKDMFNLTWGIVVGKEKTILSAFNNKTRKWMGAMSGVVYSKTDYTLSMLLINPANRIFLTCPNFNAHTEVDILSQAPKKLSNVYSLVYPYSADLWPFVLGSVVLASAAFFVISKLTIMVDKRLNRAASQRDKGVSGWFGFSALVGENMREESVEPHTKPIRLLIGIWIMSCLILSAAYAGNLKGFLTNPGMTDTIDNLKQVIESGTPYYWHNHNNLESLQDHFDPNIKTAARNGLQYPADSAEVLAGLVN